jgi:hypothetical protein
MNQLKDPTYYSIVLSDDEICRVLACIASTLDMQVREFSKTEQGMSSLRQIESLGEDIWNQLSELKVNETVKASMPACKPRLSLVR